MLTAAQFAALVSAIEREGIDPITAELYAILIGDTPERDEFGKVIVRGDNGNVMARLTLDGFFG